MKQIEIGHLKPEDYQELLTAMKASYMGWSGSFWTLETIEKLIAEFPEGLKDQSSL